jgi:hypothetical protein
MKTNLGFLVIAAVAGGLLGFGVEKILASQRRMGSGSIAGQTLTDLSRALESEKERSGAYPESISGLEVLSDSGEFSPAVLRRVVYRKTTNGYVAFVGSPDVVYIEPDKSAQHVSSHP